MTKYIMRAELTNGIYHLIEKDGKFKELFNHREICEICVTVEEEAKKAFLYMHPEAEVLQ